MERAGSSAVHTAKGADASLAEAHLAAPQALTDLRRLGELIHEGLAEPQSERQTMYEGYAAATPPRKNKTASVAYRMRNLFLDRWNLWPRLRFYRSRKDPAGESILDGTHQATERAIGG